MWIVRLALRRPYTFVVLAMLILILGPLAILRTPTDIFPTINIPVVSVVWNYAGLSRRRRWRTGSSSITERALTTTVNDIEHIESQSLRGVASSRSSSSRARSIERADRAGHRGLADAAAPAAAGHDAAADHQLQRLERARSCSSRCRGRACPSSSSTTTASTSSAPQLVTVQGAAIPYPYGGKQRAGQGRPRPRGAAGATGCRPPTCVNAINAQNLILPAGTAKIGALEYDVDLNGSPRTVAELNDLPIKTVNGTTIYIRDVAHVRDGFPPQTNIVRVDGQRAALLTDPEDRQRLDARHRRRHQGRCCRAIQASAAAGAQDQAAGRPVGVRARRRSTAWCARRSIAACLTGADDPAVPRQLAQHADHRDLDPAVDPGVDHRAERARRDAQHHDARRPRARGRHPGRRRDGRDREHPPPPRAGQATSSRRSSTAPQQIAVPAFVSTLCICIVFVPMFFLTGVGALPVRAAGRGGGVRDARVLPAVAHAGADDGEVPAARRTSRTRTAPTRPAAIRWSRLQRGVRRAASSACATRYRGAARALPCSSRGVFVLGCSSAAAWLVAAARPVAGRGLLPGGRQRPVQAARARADRHAHRGDRARCATRSRASIREDDPARRARQHHRQHRPAVQRHQPLVQQLGADRRRPTPTSW